MPRTAGRSRKRLKLCFDRVLTDDENLEAARRLNEIAGATATPTPSGGPLMPSRDVFVFGKLWKRGQTLRVRFLEGDSRVHTKVEQVAHEWSQFANIKFTFGNDPNAEIRISFTHDPGSWSYIGTDALGIPKDQPTMNYGWLRLNSPNEEYNRVVLHEFGHALGLAHEHQNPAVNIPWNKPAVYRAYAGPPNNWSKAQVDVNLFNTYAEDQVIYSQFDRHSIMLYPIPKELTDGVFEVGWNTMLSDLNKTYIGREAYPFDERTFSRLIVGAPPTEAEIGQHGEVDDFRFMVAQAGNFVVETGGRTDVKMQLFGPDSLELLVGEDDDSGRGLNARIEAALQPGTYHVFVKHFRPTGTGKYTIAVTKV